MMGKLFPKHLEGRLERFESRFAWIRKKVGAEITDSNRKQPTVSSWATKVAWQVQEPTIKPKKISLWQTSQNGIWS